MAFFGLKLGLDLEMQAAHPHQNFKGVLPPSQDLQSTLANSLRTSHIVKQTIKRPCDIQLSFLSSFFILSNTETMDKKDTIQQYDPLTNMIIFVLTLFTVGAEINSVCPFGGSGLYIRV